MTLLASLVARTADPAVPVYSVATLVNGQVETATQSCRPSLLFQAASISKPVAAVAALVLVGQGRLDLDEDINAKLRSWKLPAPADWPVRVTLRHLLSHGGALTVRAFPGYRHNTPLPGLPQILGGLAPANSSAVRVTGLPGLVPRYSGGGYTVLQLLLQDATGTEFGTLVTDLVLKPAGMFSAQYAQPEPAVAAPATAGGLPVPNGWNIHPELAAAGLWCTPTDLVRFAAALQSALAGTGPVPNQPPLLPVKIAKDLFAEQLPGWGLGVELAGTGAGRRFGHTGSNEGYRCEVTATVAPGPAIAVMTATDKGTQLIDRLLPEIRTQLSWPDPPKAPTATAYRPSGADMEQLTKLYGGDYETPKGEKITLTGTGWRWSITLPGQPPLPLEPKSYTSVSPPTFWGVDIEFQLGSGGRATGLTISQDDGVIRARRV
ncbi:serine hydrolase domain-containing protein [Longispora urticae]